jgi:hypothetical protein
VPLSRGSLFLIAEFKYSHPELRDMHAALIVGQFRLTKMPVGLRNTILAKAKSILESKVKYVRSKKWYEVTSMNPTSHVYREDIDTLFAEFKPYFSLFDFSLWLLDNLESENWYHEGKN